MADQQDASLLERADSQSSVVNEAQPRSRPSDLKIAGFILLACMLIAGQGLTAYFVINQKSQISSLEKTSELLKIKLTQQQHRGSSSASKIHMPMLNMPLMMLETTDADSKKTTPMKKLEDTVTASVQKQVKDVLKDFKLPQFNASFVANLQGLKEQMGSDWKSFESWMEHWIVFQLAQQKHPASTPAPSTPAPSTPPPVTASVIKTKCQLEAGEKRIGSYKTQCDEQGNYFPMQCWHGTGFCWCVDKEGVMIPNTQMRGRPMCGGMAVTDNLMAKPSLTRMMMDEEDFTQ